MQFNCQVIVVKVSLGKCWANFIAYSTWHYNTLKPSETLEKKKKDLFCHNMSLFVYLQHTKTDVGVNNNQDYKREGKEAVRVTLVEAKKGVNDIPTSVRICENMTERRRTHCHYSCYSYTWITPESTITDTHFWNSHSLLSRGHTCLVFSQREIQWKWKACCEREKTKRVKSFVYISDG